MDHCIHIQAALLHSDSAGNDHCTRFFQLVLNTMQKKKTQTALLIWHLNRPCSKCQQLSHVQPVSCHISANIGWVLTMGISLSTLINARLCTRVTECDVLIHARFMVSCINCYENYFHKTTVFNWIGNEVISQITMYEREAQQRIQQTFVYYWLLQKGVTSSISFFIRSYCYKI